MDIERTLSQFSTDTYANLASNKQRITKKLDTLGLSPKHQQKFTEMIIKIAKITDNPKTRQSYLRSAYRIVTQDITGEGRGGSIIIEITKKCNKNCTHCYSKFSDQLQEMPDTILTSIVNYAHKHLKHIFVTGGEPTLDPRIFTLAQQYPDIIFFIFTNGSTLTKEYAKKLSQFGNIIPLIGIDGACQKTHDRFRGDGSYQEVTQAIENCNAYHVAWGFITLVAETNAKEVLHPSFVEDKIRKGAIIVRYLEYLPIGPHPLLECILSGKTYYHLEKRKNEIIKNGTIYMQEIVQKKCNGLIFFTVSGHIKNCFCFHYSKYNIQKDEIKKSIENTRKEWISPAWDGECPLYSNPIGFKNHLENIGWKNVSIINEPYLSDPKIAQLMIRNYREFLKLKAEKGL